MVFELLVSFGIQIVKYYNLNISHVEYVYINTTRETSDIRKKYVPIFLNIFIVTGNQIMIKMYETAPSKDHLGFFLVFMATVTTKEITQLKNSITKSETKVTRNI